MPTAARRRSEQKYESQPQQKKNRASRNKARRQMIKAGKAHKGDGMDVEHINGNPMSTPKKGTKGLKLGTKHDNRSYARTRGAHKVNPRS